MYGTTKKFYHLFIQILYIFSETAFLWNSPWIQERLMKTESATFITETSQVNQDNINISIKKTLRIKRKVFI